MSPRKARLVLFNRRRRRANRFTPPLNRSDRTHVWRHVIIGVTAIIGILTSICMYMAVSGWKTHGRNLAFANLASGKLQTINTGLKDATDLLYSLRAYFESLDHPVTKAEFEAFAQSLRARVPGLHATDWAPRVPAAEREAFEQSVRAAGYPDFQITQRDFNGKMVQATDRAEYFPIIYAEPAGSSRLVVGYDVGSETRRGVAVGRAVLTDKPAATPPVELITMPRARGAIMSFIAVHAGRGEAGMPRPVAGVVLGAFETAAMIENILATRGSLVGMDLYVYDPNGQNGDRLVFWHSADGKPAPAEDSLRAMRHWQGTLDLVDQHWGAILTPADAAADRVVDPTAVVVLIAGLLMTIVVVGYMWFAHYRAWHLERLTTDLSKTSEELRRNGVKLDHLARHDGLTGLANRMAFREEVTSHLRSMRRGQGMAVLYLDLDRFKAVNDTLGHPAGDRLLCLVADRLRASIRETETVTRLGGDEFAIGQTGVEEPADAESLARRVIETLNRPYDINGQWAAIGASIGITIAWTYDLDVDQLLRRADMALYAAKREGRGTWRFFSASMELDAQAQRGLEMDLRYALEHDELELYYQPQVNNADGRIAAFEALLRWHHPERGLVLPHDFIQCAKETGLIVPIGNWVLHNALRQAANWPSDVRVAVNLSPQQLAHDDLAEMIEAALAASGQPASRLELEITEPAMAAEYVAGQIELKRLQARGVTITLDEFGTGCASLVYLGGFPFDRIKVDRSFVRGVTESARGAAIVRAVLQLATTLDITSVAEGVETPAQLDHLTEMGCNHAQGFLFSPAVTASAAAQLLVSTTIAPRRRAVASGVAASDVSLGVATTTRADR